MSHNISTAKDGTAEVFVAGQAAWHNLGARVDKAQTWKQAVKLAHLQWDVVKEQLASLAGVAVNAFGLFRSDDKRFLSAVGPDYEPIQNADCFTFVDYLLGQVDGAHYETAGSLGNGETVWALAQMPEVIRIKGTDDISKNYLLFVDYRKQGKAAVAKLTSTRVVCNNTLTMALSDNEKIFRIRHNADVKSKLELAKTAILGVRGDIADLDKKLNFLASKLMTRESMTTILEHLFPNIKESNLQQARANDILERYEDNDGNVFKTERGTAFNLLNAVTRYVDHVQSVPVRVADGTTNLVAIREQKRAESSLFGSGDRFKTEALEVILSNVQTNPDNSAAGRQTWIQTYAPAPVPKASDAVNRIAAQMNLSVN